MSFFKFSFEDVIQHHIRHQFYDEMSANGKLKYFFKNTNANSVPLGEIPKNENKADEMVEIMSMLHKYVPTVDFTTTEIVLDSGEAIHAVFQPVNFCGELFTAVRGRGAQRMRSNSLSPRLEGLFNSLC